MNLADLSIKRPTFMACLIILSVVIGLAGMKRLGVDLFPDVTFPIVTVTTVYPGAGPAEVETLVTKPVEDEVSTISGIKRLSSSNQEGVSVVIAEFTMETDVKYAEQQVRDRVAATKRKLPTDIKDPVIRRVDPSDQPIVILSVKADLREDELYDLAYETIKPKLEQIANVGLIDILGGRKRELHVALDRTKLKAREVSASLVAQRIAGAGEDIPSGKRAEGAKETIFRTVGQFKSLQDIKSLVLSFYGNDVSTRISDVGEVIDTLEDETSRTYLNGQRSLFIYAFKQSGSNTVAVVDAIKAKVEKINAEIKDKKGTPSIALVRDAAVPIRINIADVNESIYIGIGLAVVVVFFFLANFRSTIITGLALPNSLIGAFILMWLAGYSINIMTLLALSLSVGLLIDDAIVVRENIFRHIEMGKTPKQAALIGTQEVSLAVIATTLTVIAVFGPLGFLKGVVGQFFKQFGLTVCFAMAISLFDALTVAPMLSAYFAGNPHKKPSPLFANTIGVLLNAFEKFQVWLENGYEKLLRKTVKRPFMALLVSTVIFLLTMSTIIFVPKTFLPAQDAGEFTIGLDLPPGTSLQAMSEVALKVDESLRKNAEVAVSALTVGSRQGDPNYADIYVHLVDSKQRKVNTSQFKERLRNQLKDFAYANPKVKDYDAVGAGQRPFNLNILGQDQKMLEEYSLRVKERLQQIDGLVDVDVNFRPGKPEFQIRPDKARAQQLGVTTASLGMELRTQIEGIVPAKYREGGIEYDVRVRLQDSQRNLKEGFDSTYVPNINGSLVKLSNVAQAVATDGPSKITRQDRNRYIQVNADLRPGSKKGLGDIMTEIDGLMKNELKPPVGVNYAFVGQAENFKEMLESMVFAMGAGILFIYLVLASLYESFVTPFTIMLALPMAVCGSIVALAITQESFNIFSMIGVIMLLGVATKNSILLVDYAHQLGDQGVDRDDAIVKAGKTRLRPILMTTMALIAGTIPIAMGLNEASKQRTSMGVAIIGGLVSSTLLTLLVVPAAYSFIDRFRVWSKGIMMKIFTVSTDSDDKASAKSNH